MNGTMHIQQNGPLTLLIQGQGTGRQHLGFSPGGAIDEHAFWWANKLAGNYLSDIFYSPGTLEITLGPFSCIFHQTAKIAITGAAGNIKLNETRINAWQNIDIKPGDRLAIAPPQHGLRTYIAVTGGFKAVSNTGAESSHWQQNRDLNLDKHNQIFYDENCFKRLTSDATPARFIPNYDAPLTLQLIPAYQYEQFSEQAINTLLTQKYTISPMSNRMGYRLQGEPITFCEEALLSEGIAYGSVQIPPNGQPIVLLKDRQTIGGYPKLGCISQQDCFKLGQRRPGQEITFTLKTAEHCLQQLRTFYQFFSATNS